MIAKCEIPLFLAAGLLVFAMLGDRGFTSEEVRWAQIAREMRHSGDYFHPTFNGQLYYDKPLASYWLIVTASAITGTVDEFTARLPSALAALIAVALTLRLGGQAYGPRTGRLAAIVLATSFGFAFYARRASADLENLAGILAAVVLFAAKSQSRSTVWVLALWAIMGVTSSMKGLLGFALPVLILGSFGALNALRGCERGLAARLRSENRWLFNRWSLLAIPLGLAIFLAPYLASALQSGSSDGLTLLVRENLQRFVAPHNHKGPVYLYLGALALLAAPWSLYLPAALWPRPGNQSPLHRLIVVMFWATLIFFTASASRRSYYLLPILPVCSLLVSRVLRDREPTKTADRLRTSATVLFAFALAVMAVALALPVTVWPHPYDKLPRIPARWFAVIVAAAGCVGLLRNVWRRAVPMGELVLFSFAMLTAIQFVLLPLAEGYRTRRDFATAVRNITRAEPERLALFHSRDIVFELAFEKPVPDFLTAAELHYGLPAGNFRWLIVRRRYVPQIEVPFAKLAEEAEYPWEPLDQLADKMMLVELLPR